MHSIVVTKHEDPVFAALNALDGAVDALLATDITARSTRDQLGLLRRLEIVAARLPAIGHRAITALRESATRLHRRWLPQRSPPRRRRLEKQRPVVKHLLAVRANTG